VGVLNNLIFISFQIKLTPMLEFFYLVDRLKNQHFSGVPKAIYT